jgi:hypothetical protein
MSNPFRQQGKSDGTPANAVQNPGQTSSVFSDPLELIDKGQAVSPESGAIDRASGSRNEYNIRKPESRTDAAEDSGSEDSLPDQLEEIKSKYVTNPESHENLLNSIPRNPFAKTVGTTVSDGSSENLAQPRHSVYDRNPKRGSKTMDVDSFKSLILTGTAAQSSADTAVNWRGVHPSDSTSSTETSSISRYSLMENVSGHSFDTFAHDSLLPEDSVKPKVERPMKRPPPPKSKHGKALLPRGPQTVPFDDFSPNVPLDSVSTNAKDSIKSPTSDISRASAKPLPTPPAIHSQQADYVEIQPQTEDEVRKENVPSQSKTAPPPPLARRSTVTKRTRANTTSSIKSVNEEGQSSYPPSIAESISSQKPAPPPPPARRTGSAVNIPLSSGAAQGPANDRTSLDIRTPHSSNRNRSSSQISLVSPPPPPPARRWSSKSSVDAAQKVPGSASHSRRSSTEIVRSSFDSQRRTPSGQPEQPIFEEVDTVEKAQEVASPKPPSSSAKDILADMDAFAEELEKLKNRYQGSK